MAADGSPSSSGGSSSGNISDSGLYISMGKVAPARQPETASRAASEPAKDRGERPILRLAMLNAQEKAKLQAHGEHASTAPMVSRPIELPETGYFAPRGALARAHTLVSSPAPVIGQATAAETSPAIAANLPTPAESTRATAEPGGLRRRLTRATASIMRLGGRRGPRAGAMSTSDTESDMDSDHERRMERLLNARGNTAETAPTNNIDANNADITSQPGFYPLNLSMDNPGVVHMNMSGHQAAKNIVDSVLGTVGTSTAQQRQRKKPEADNSDTTPGDLEAGLGRRVKFVDGSAAASGSGARRRHGSGDAAARLGSCSPLAAPGGGGGVTAASLRGVYANLTKLQSRMAEHQEKRDERMRDERAREAQLRSARAKRRPHEPTVLGAVGSRIREIPERIGRARRRSGSGDSAGDFVLHSFRAAPRPASITNLGELLSAALHSQATTPGASPPRQPSAAHSPLGTPSWDDVAWAGSAGGSRMSLASVDTTMQAFDAEKQKILAELADIFDRQNFLLVASRALMGFGAPLHRLEANLVAVALHLDVAATFAALPGIILITFGDQDTRTSETYVVRMAPGFDMHRLERTNRAIRRVLKGRMSVGRGVKALERVLATPPLYPWWAMIADYVVSSFVICPLFWSGSWRDAAVSALLGLAVSLLQLTAGRFANYANLFEVSSAFIVSFIAALLQDFVCFGIVSFSGIAMLLPGVALTTSIVEMASRNVITGTVRFIFAMCRCFMLGYGISVGSMLGTRVLGRSTTVDLLADQMRSNTGLGNCGSGVSKYWWFLLLPVLSLAFNISISAHWRQWPAMLVAGCLAYTVAYFSALSEALAPLAPAIAAFAMGLFANAMATFTNHRSAIEPILGGVQLLVPGSLGLRTVLAFISSSGSSSGNFLYDMFSTSLSIAVGLFLSGMVVFPNRKKRVGLMTY
ncbi:pheromone-regulated protein prm10 [Coemansia sp. RSA 2322]|nr:pheromone-regulated protein prm10 [Coemansia sp. RSA 2322]